MVNERSDLEEKDTSTLMFEGQANRTQTLVPRSLINSESNLNVENESLIGGHQRMESQHSEKKKIGNVFKQDNEYPGKVFYVNPKMKILEKESSEEETKHNLK